MAIDADPQLLERECLGRRHGFRAAFGCLLLNTQARLVLHRWFGDIGCD